MREGQLGRSSPGLPSQLKVFLRWWEVSPLPQKMPALILSQPLASSQPKPTPCLSLCLTTEMVVIVIYVKDKLWSFYQLKTTRHQDVPRLYDADSELDWVLGSTESSDEVLSHLPHQRMVTKHFCVHDIALYYLWRLPTPGQQEVHIGCWTEAHA